VGPVRHLVLAAIDRDANSVADYDIARAIRLVTLKLVGYTEVVHVLRSRLVDGASLVLFGGMAKERPYPGSTTVSTVNGGVVGLTRSLVEELKPKRVNSIHPGIVGDSPFWAEKAAAVANSTAQTPTGQLARMQDVVGATVFLLENQAVNGVDLIVDGGWHCR
jgi:NAD(P)-dependent dehydrogenase (short-subunit alcohol dehydrogenase family)